MKTRKRYFLKGPISMDWLGTAARLPGKALHVAVLLQHVAGIESQRRFKFTRKWANRFGLAPKTVGLCLQRLQEAGLVRVERIKGRAPIVTILEICQ